MTIIDGKEISAQILEETRQGVIALHEQRGIVPGLALLLVGSDAASEVYVSSKDKACKEVGIASTIVRLPETTTEDEIIAIVREWNADPAVHGILVQLPLPKHVNEHRVIMTIDPSKDVDGFHPENAGRLMIGLPGFVPCTPLGVMELLKRYTIPTKGKHVVVVGRSNIVGKPMANLLCQKHPHANAVVTICHSAASDISMYTKQADILVAAVGVAHLIKAKDVKEGVVVIDVGMNRIPDATKKSGTRLVGDVDFDDVASKASAMTPVPGGVGKMTIAMLLHNTLRSAEGVIFG